MANYGFTFTWNDKGAVSRIFLKIDWSFINGERLLEMPGCKTQFLNEGVSDHNPIHVKLDGVPSKKKGAFIYCNIWSQHPSFK